MMTRTLFHTVLAMSCLLLGLAGCTAKAPTLKYVPVARYIRPARRYANLPSGWETVGARASMILRAKNIAVTGAGSSEMILSVPADQAAESLELLAKAVNTEHLPLILLIDKKGHAEAVTPESILAPQTAK